MYRLSNKSLDNLIGVHNDLVRVVKRAIEITQYDFGVGEGLREHARQLELMEAGKTRTMKSMHLPQKDGLAHAVDLIVYVDGKPTWEHKYFRKVVQAMFTAATELGVQITAGALWRDFLDSPHFELNQAYY